MSDLTVSPLNAPTRTLSVLMADTVESTKLTSRLGHERAERLMTEHLDSLAQIVDAHGGLTMRRLGDGLMASFESAVAALDAAAHMHRDVARRNDERDPATALRIRISVAVSDVLIVDDDIVGAAPTHAARTEKLVPAGETWCTDAVRLLSRGRGGHEFDNMGFHELKGIDEPVALHRVRVSVADMLGMPAALDAVRRFDFVGRREESERLYAAWRGAVGGAGQVLLVIGEPGVGKTRLCRELAIKVRGEGSLVLHGHCPEEASEAFAPFVQILRTVLARVTDAAALLGAGAAEPARLVPEIRSSVPGLDAPSNVDASTDLWRLFDAVVSWLRAVAARTPVLLVIDDVSWADEQSVQLLRFIAERIGNDQMLVVASYRSSTANPATRSLLRLDRRIIDQLRLHGLPDNDVLAFVSSLLGGELDESAQATAIDIGRLVGGNPLYLGEMVPSLVEGHVLEPAGGAWRRGSSQLLNIPASLEDLVRGRVERLSRSCQDVLRTAAMMNVGFSAELLVDVLETSPLIVADALEEASAADLVLCASDSITFSFTHAVIRQAIDDSISVPRRGAEHRRIAETIEQRYGTRLDHWAEVLAYHYENGLGWRDATRAIAYLRTAGAVASGRLAYDHAADFYRRAKAIAERFPETPAEVLCDVLTELGTAQRRGGSDEARGTFNAATELALALGDSARATRAVLGVGRGTFSRAGTVDTERIQMLRRVLAVTGPEETERRAQLLATLSSELAFDDDPTTAEAASDEALAIARDAGDVGLLVTVLGNRLVALWRIDRIDQRLAHAAELEAICNLAGDRVRGKFLSAMTACCQAAIEAGDFVRGDRLLAWLEETAETLHQPTSVAFTKVRLASRACLTGRFGEAESLAGEAYRLCTQAGQPDAEAFFVGQLFSIRYHQGRTEDIIDHLSQMAERNPGVVAFAAGEAVCAAELGDDARCRSTIGPVIERLETIRNDLNWMTTMALTAAVVHHLDDTETAARLRLLIAPYHHLFVDNASTNLGSVHHYEALLCSTVGDEAAADTAFRAAIAAHTDLDSPPWRARTHVEYATELARRGVNASVVRTQATAALNVGRERGLRAVVARASAILARDSAIP